MNPPEHHRADVERQVKDCYSTWGGRYYDEYYGDAAPYPPVHRDLIVALLGQAGAQRVLDAGCGPASMMRDLIGAGFDVQGFDLTPEMIDEARRVLTSLDRPADDAWLGSVLDPEAFRPPDRPATAPPDAVVCVGVLPHIPADADATVVDNLVQAVRPGGTVVVEARNELFALFTLNRFTHELFTSRLVPAEALRAAAGDDATAAVLEELGGMFRTDLPPVRTGVAGEPGYDEVLSRTHNPFELAGTARRAGLVDVATKFFHFHALPPMFADRLPDATRAASLAAEDPDDWRGHFLASAFVVVGRRP